MATVTFHLNVGGGLAVTMPDAQAVHVAATVNQAVSDPANHNNTFTIYPDSGGELTVRVGDVAHADVD